MRHPGPNPSPTESPSPSPRARAPPSASRSTSDPGMLLGVDGWVDHGEGGDSLGSPSPGTSNGRSNPSPNVLSFRYPNPSPHGASSSPAPNPHPSLSPVSGGLNLLAAPKRQRRKVPKVPFKVLDAPQLQDDFYLNLVDWSNANVLAVGLGSCVYLWSACTSKVTKLCDVGPQDTVTSVSWTQRGSHLAVGTSMGTVQIWDSVKCKKLRTFSEHTARVGTMAWNAHLLATGSRDKLVFVRDVRARDAEVSRLSAHKQEICGLKWSFDDNKLASGGNDNKLLVWSLAKGGNAPLHRFSAHTAAVKAIAWSPHQHGLLASGGGTADRCIRFWNTLTGAPLSCMDTGSQVCNLMWSRNCNEIVSTHGYSLNQIILWKYPSMTKVATLTGHSFRVLYLSMSPDGQTIVTGAGDETLRFWNVFPGSKNKDGARMGQSLLFPGGHDIR
mmetsp:Transcript_35042/g.110245  ORF Transcript_35042/g.110245 Transcript_35042/m.110245 type:complete len:442 (-) Transcript_35042:481-1806(-)